MTSEERREGRYQRRKMAREEKIEERSKTFEEVFTFRNLYRGYLKSRKGVMWKASTQTYKANALPNVRKTAIELAEGRWKSKGFCHFDLYDRGKLRHIRSVHISERVVQHALCDEILTPAITPALVFDNAGSLKDKGMDFSLKRCRKHITEAVRLHGRDNVYVLLYDFKGYFDNVDHDEAMIILKRYIRDERCLALARQLIDDFGEKGVGLGSQVSQTIATAMPNPVDHHFKDTLRFRWYGRYMDDGYAIHHDKKFLEECLIQLNDICESLDIRLNTKKTRIVPLRRGFEFLKMRFIIADSGAIVQRVSRKTIVRQRRKLKKLFKMYREKKVTLENIDTTMASTNGHLKRANAFHARMNLKNLYFKELTKKEDAPCM